MKDGDYFRGVIDAVAAMQDILGQTRESYAVTDQVISRLKNDLRQGGAYFQYHEPVCPGCGADLTVTDSVEVSFSDGISFTNTSLSCVTPSGRLLDPNGQISIGMHSGSSCVNCSEWLDELDGPLTDNE